MTVTVDPRALFERLAAELPAELIDRLFVIGSLAAACHHVDRVRGGVKTKDADLVLHPAGDGAPARELARLLLARGWRHRRLGGFPPGTADTPVDQLPAIRLYPPEHEDYFVELLIVPAGERAAPRTWLRVELHEGYFGLPSFEFLALTALDRCRFGGLEYARPSMMALANLLSHPALDRDPPMSTPIEDRAIHRSSKDLGRVIALAWLEPRAEIDRWAERWERALRRCFPTRWRELARRSGAGLRALLTDVDRFDEAHHSCIYGLLRGHGVTHPQLRATAAQLLADAIGPLETAALVSDRGRSDRGRRGRGRRADRGVGR